MLKTIFGLASILLLSYPLAIEATQVPAPQPTKVINKTLISQKAKTQTVKSYKKTNGTKVKAYRRSPRK